MRDRYDIAIVGGGIVGLPTAYALLQRHPELRILVLEKEPQLAMHQSGHNSGVIHSGIYYRPGSLKAKLCVGGGRQLTAFCDAHGIAYQRCGIVIVAVTQDERARLDALYERGLANGVPGLARIGPERLRELEPHVRGLAALHLPQVGIVDFRAVATAIAREITRAGGDIRTAAQVTQLRAEPEGWRLVTPGATYHAECLVNCGGLHADTLARLAGDRADVRLVPFRGEYYMLPPSRHGLVRGLVYPVPDPAMPFLGVHFTKMLDGGVHVGPNAVLALKREGYRRSDVSWRDCGELLVSGGFWRMVRRYWRAGLEESVRSWSRRALLRAARRLVPALTLDDLQPSPAGVRAQAIAPDGALLDDFVLRDAPHALHVYNAPSPAATASLSIGAHIADRVAAMLPARAAS